MVPPTHIARVSPSVRKLARSSAFGPRLSAGLLLVCCACGGSGDSDVDEDLGNDVMLPGADGGNENSENGDDEPATLESVLVFSHVAGYRHEAITPGLSAFEMLGANNGFQVTRSEDPADFTDDNLAGYDVVVWFCTTGDVLNADQEAAFERYIQSGGGWVGIHSASDTEYDWAWYGELIGGSAWFLDHPPGMSTATLEVDPDNAGHISVQHLPESFSVQDEWYNFRANPSGEVSVVLRIDEASYDPGENAMGEDHPMAWYHEFDGGRAWYTALGHRIALYEDERFLQHVLGGIRWASGVSP